MQVTMGGGPRIGDLRWQTQRSRTEYPCEILNVRGLDFELVCAGAASIGKGTFGYLWSDGSAPQQPHTCRVEVTNARGGTFEARFVEPSREFSQWLEQRLNGKANPLPESALPPVWQRPF